jgi:putative ABC transport system permease protein
VVTFHVNDREIRKSIDVVREELLKNSLIEDVGTAGNPIGNNNIGGRDYKVEIGGAVEERTRLANYINVDEDFIPTLQIQFAEGRNFDKKLATDKDRAVIVNEALVYDAGWDVGVGKKIKMGDMMYDIIGVVKDFNIYSLQHKIEPLILQLPMNAYDKDNVYVRVSGTGALKAIEDVYKKYDTSGPFEYSFLDQNFDRQYRSEQMQGNLLLTFTGLAIAIACLGLFGLITFITEQRRKEIGIRKVLGGSVAGIVVLLAKKLLILVIVAALIATPIAWYAMNGWLQEFAYHIEIGAWVFVVAGISAVIVAMLTVSTQAARSALANPTDALRSE